MNQNMILAITRFKTFLKITFGIIRKSRNWQRQVILKRVLANFYQRFFCKMDGFSPSTSNLQSNFLKVNCASTGHMSRQYSKFYYAQNCDYFILRMYICFHCVQNCNSFNTRSRLLSLCPNICFFWY